MYRYNKTIAKLINRRLCIKTQGGHVTWDVRWRWALLSCRACRWRWCCSPWCWWSWRWTPSGWRWMRSGWCWTRSGWRRARRGSCCAPPGRAPAPPRRRAAATPRRGRRTCCALYRIAHTTLVLTEDLRAKGYCCFPIEGIWQRRRPTRVGNERRGKVNNCSIRIIIITLLFSKTVIWLQNRHTLHRAILTTLLIKNYKTYVLWINYNQT